MSEEDWRSTLSYFCSYWKIKANPIVSYVMGKFKANPIVSYVMENNQDQPYRILYHGED